MMCLAIGLGVLGLVAWKRARWYRRMYRGGHGGCGHGGGCGPDGGGWPHHGGWHHHHHGGGRWRRRWFLGMAFQRLEATPAQERAIVAELDALEERLKATRESLKAARGELAEVVRGPVVDDAALVGLLARIDAATQEARAAMIDALRKIHALLDAKQRNQLAELLGKSWRGGGGPYRG